MAALRSVAMGPAIGHLLSLLLHLAEMEAAAGHSGSRAVRVAALGTLRCLLQQVHS